MNAMPQAKRNEKGQSLVELGIGLLILLLLLAGIVDLGRMVFFYISLRDAAQEGTVFGQINPRSCTQINDRISEVLKMNTPNPPEVSIDGVSCLTAASEVDRSCSGKEIKVRLVAPFTFAMPLLGGHTINLSTEISGTILRPGCGT